MGSRKRQRGDLTALCSDEQHRAEPQGDCARADKRSPLAEGVNEAQSRNQRGLPTLAEPEPKEGCLGL